MRLIDADLLEPSEVYMNYGFTRIVYMDDIDEMPTIEAEPVRHGEWKHTFGGYVNCSVCGATPLLDGEREYVETYYCPNCGAKMDLEE